MQKFTLDLKASEQGRITAYAAVFGNVDRQGERIERGAFTKSLAAGAELPLLAGHDQTQFPVGRILSMTEDAKGLLIEAQLTLETERGKEAWALIKSGALTGLSIGYRVAPGGAKQAGNVRELHELELLECSLVSVPANPEARIVKFKSMTTASDLRGFLMQRGLSRGQADDYISAGFKALGTNPDVDFEAAAAKWQHVNKLFS